MSDNASRYSSCLKSKDVESPGGDVDVQPALKQFRSISFVNVGTYQVFKDDWTACQIFKRETDVALAVIWREVDHNQQSIP